MNDDQLTPEGRDDALIAVWTVFALVSLTASTAVQAIVLCATALLLAYDRAQREQWARDDARALYR